MISASSIKKGKTMLHPFNGKLLLDREATASVLECHTSSLYLMREKNDENRLMPLLTRYKKCTWYYAEDVETRAASHKPGK